MRKPSPATQGSDELSTIEQASAGIDTALARNAVFAARGEHEGATVFPTLGLVVVTCMDPRVDPAHVLGLELGDGVVIRNTGGRVTFANAAAAASSARPNATKDASPCISTSTPPCADHAARSLRRCSARTAA